MARLHGLVHTEIEKRWVGEELSLSQGTVELVTVAPQNHGGYHLSAAINYLPHGIISVVYLAISRLGNVSTCGRVGHPWLTWSDGWNLTQ